MVDYERRIRELFMAYPQFSAMDMEMKLKVTSKAFEYLDIDDACRVALDKAIEFYSQIS